MVFGLSTVSATWRHSSLSQKPTVLVTRFTSPVNTQPTDFAMQLTQFVYPFTTTDSSRVLQSNVYDFVQEGHFLMAFELTDGSQGRNLLVSTDLGESFNPAIFPGAGRISSLSLVDASEGLIFVVAQHTVSSIRGSKFLITQGSLDKAST